MPPEDLVDAAVRICDYQTSGPQPDTLPLHTFAYHLIYIQKAVRSREAVQEIVDEAVAQGRLEERGRGYAVVEATSQ